MKKHLLVRQKDCLNQSQQILHQGICEYERHFNQIILTYQESEGDGKVEVNASMEGVTITRVGEAQSVLHLQRQKHTTATVTSQYGSLEMGLYTYFYRMSEHLIVVEYDVMSDAQNKTRFRFSWHISDEFS